MSAFAQQRLDLALRHGAGVFTISKGLLYAYPVNEHVLLLAVLGDNPVELRFHGELSIGALAGLVEVDCFPLPLSLKNPKTATLQSCFREASHLWSPESWQVGIEASALPSAHPRTVRLNARASQDEPSSPKAEEPKVLFNEQARHTPRLSCIPHSGELQHAHRCLAATLFQDAPAQRGCCLAFVASAPSAFAKALNGSSDDPFRDFHARSSQPHTPTASSTPSRRTSGDTTPRPPPSSANPIVSFVPAQEVLDRLRLLLPAGMALAPAEQPGLCLPDATAALLESPDLSVVNAPSTLVMGAKGVGKSTLCQLLINRHFESGTQRVAVLDLDLGQSLYALPGSVALQIESAASWRDPVTRLGLASDNLICFWVGYASPKLCPDVYYSAVRRAYEAYKLAHRRGCFLYSPDWLTLLCCSVPSVVGGSKLVSALTGALVALVDDPDLRMETRARRRWEDHAFSERDDDRHEEHAVARAHRMTDQSIANLGLEVRSISTAPRILGLGCIHSVEAEKGYLVLITPLSDHAVRNCHALLPSHLELPPKLLKHQWLNRDQRRLLTGTVAGHNQLVAGHGLRSTRISVGRFRPNTS
ncbi:uncharacterized protein MONBRDRAFT_9767 [Monosiga brevicollis MX1]|uniref:Clp1 P-loop domain-containing protein n=1 Tax=Monosiga brevicollis TaxID=81824 RepID=A9V462_MONBE|nr:uncharacterized protein MONBRDRAFT_9767 [Monosiga brevicollis MX1]EDQ87564.1 predicted protein [Monosiga brevicollis MX1]|eukprot:XP_001747484.1 hypothetical protein [Monosiga brevicollis MX1]